MSIFKVILNFVKFIRLRDWWYLNGIAILGFLSDNTLASTSSFWLLIQCILVSSLYLAYGYSQNEFFDNFDHCSQYVDISHRLALKLSSFCLFLINLVVSYLLAKTVFLLVFIGGVISFLYSSKSIRLKRLPLVRLFLNALGFSLLFLIGASIDSVLSIRELGLFLYIFLLFIPIELIHDLNDVKWDGKNLITTLPLKYGISFCRILVIFCFIFLLVFSIILFLLKVFGIILAFLTFLLVFCLTVLLFLGQRDIDASNYSGIKSKARFMLSLFGVILLVVFIFRN